VSDFCDLGTVGKQLPFELFDRRAMRRIDNVLAMLDVEGVQMLARPSCSCAIFTGTRRSLSSDE